MSFETDCKLYEKTWPTDVAMDLDLLALVAICDATSGAGSMIC